MSRARLGRVAGATYGRLPIDPRENLERRAAYQALCDGRYAVGSRDTLVLAVSDVDLDERDGDIHLAAGLGLALVDLGHGVRLVPRDRWHTVGPCDVFLGLTPDLDPSYAPHGAWKVAWVRSEVERWAASSRLIAYDQVMAAAPVALRRLARETPRAHGVLQPGVDTELFGAVDPEAERLPVAVTTVPCSDPPRAVHRALAELPGEADVAAYTSGWRRASDELARWCRPEVAYFATPDLYRRSAIVIGDADQTALGHFPDHRLLEAAACGAVPVVNDVRGFRRLGLTGIPSYRTGADLARVLGELRADPAGLRDRGRELLETVRRAHSWDRRARAFVERLDEARAAGTPPAPTTAIHVFPDYSRRNPYQRMLYGGLSDLGAYTVLVHDLAAHLLRQVEQPEEPGCLHVHWTDPVLQWAPGPFRAKLVLDRVSAMLERFKARGGRLVWTIHNVLPHDVRYAWAEVQLARLLADSADLVHVMSEQTLAEAEGHYRLDPSRLVVIPHSSYAGQYPDRVSRSAARRRLGLGPEDKVLIALGGLRPYKRLDRLLDNFDEIAREDPAVRLLIAGQPANDPGIEALVERCRNSPRVTGHYEHLPDDQLQVWMKAADLAVLPYQNVLNSGAFLLAETFGLPVVGPNRGTLGDSVGAEHVLLFDPDRPGSLGEAVRDAVRLFVENAEGAERARASALASAATLPPESMAADFARAVEPVLRRRPTPARAGSVTPM